MSSSQDGWELFMNFLADTKQGDYVWTKKLLIEGYNPNLVTEFTISKNTDVTINIPVLHIVARLSSDADILRFFLEHSPDPNVLDEYGGNVMHHVAYPSYEFYKLALDFNIDLFRCALIEKERIVLMKMHGKYIPSYYGMTPDELWAHRFSWIDSEF